MSSQNFQSITEGKGVRTKTGPSLNSNALVDSYISVMDTEMGTCTVTANANVTYTDPISGVAVAYLAGDVLFYSDGFTIWNSLNAVMFNAGGVGTGSTGGVRGLPQPVTFYKVPASLTAGHPGKTDAFFWGFFNSGEFGIYTGLIDMTLNDGRGGFSNWENSGQSTQCFGMAPSTDLGALNDSCRGTSGCMDATCYLDSLGYNIGINIFSIGYDRSASPTLGKWRGYYHTSIRSIMPTGGAGAGFPNLTAIPGVLTKVGLGVNETQGAGIQMTIKATQMVGGNNFVKTAVIIRPGTGSLNNPDMDANVEVATCNVSTGVYTNPTQVDIGQLDTGGQLGYPILSPRFYAMDLEWSHTSDAAQGLLYFPHLEQTMAAPELQIRWNYLDANNVWSVVPVTGFGHWEVVDNAGLPIWDVDQGRILAGMWRDPQKSGRIFVNTPEVTGMQSTAILSSSPIWSIDYPELYGSLTVPNPIQHYVIEDSNLPSALAPTFWGTLNASAYLTYGAPSFVACEYGGGSAEFEIVKCADAAQFLVDSANNLWKMSTSWPAAGGIANQVASLSLNNFVDISANNYYGTVYIFDIHPSSALLQYQVYNERLGTTASAVPITNVVAAGWESVEKIKYHNWIVGSGGNPTPVTSLTCDTHTFMGFRAGSTTVLALGTLRTSTNLVSTYSGVSAIDISTAFAGNPLAGSTLRGLVSMRKCDVTTVGAVTYCAFDDRIIKYTHATTTWSEVGGASGLGGNWTSLYTSRASGGNTPQLMGTVGPLGANLVYDINTTTGATTLSGTGVISNDPGGFTWPALVAGASTRNSADFFEFAPIKVTSVDSIFVDIGLICKNDEVWFWSDTEHVGCYTCGEADNHHLLSQACGTLVPSTVFDICRNCPVGINPSCETFLPCCNENGVGPMQLPGVITQGTGVLTPGNTYSVSSAGATPECGTLVVVEDNMPELWFSTTSGKVFAIDTTTGTCTVPSWSIIQGTPITGLRDIAFDRHGNIIFTQNVSDISWASPWIGYESPAELLSNVYTSLECLDTDYTASNHIVGAVMQFGVATFTKHTNVSGVLTQVSNLTNVTISLGYDLSVDYNSGDYFVLGDQTGGGALNDILIVDDVSVAATFLVDLDVLLSWSSGEEARGIERLRTTGPVSENYIISMKNIGGTHLEVSLDILNDNASLAMVPTIPLINPATGTIEWDLLDEPNGLAAKDLCSKWPNNVDPVTVSYVDCDLCVASALTEDCCYKLTECGGGLVIYSVQILLDPYVGQIISIVIPGSGDVCFHVERSSVCISPIVVVLSTVPGPFISCATCGIPSTVYYKLTNCTDPTDILYSDDVLMPVLPTIISPNVVQLDNECFCREVAINPLGPSGTEAAYVILNTIAGCSDCRFYIELINCIDGTSIYVDYNNSPSVVAAMALGQAHNVTLSGVPEIDCYEIVNTCLGPTSTIFPTGIITSSSINCNACANINQICWEVKWCCDPNVITYVYDTSGITLLDMNLVVIADITITGVLYTGCWEVSQCAGACCNVAIPDSDVNVIASSTIGSGALPDCASCPVSPCNDPCVLLKACNVSNPDITVSGGQGTAIGTDVVNFVGISGCYYVCTANLIHGTHWFWGGQSGIDWATGNVAALNLNGASNTTTAVASQTTNYTWRSSTVHSSESLVTFGAVVYNPGDLMFYSDGKYIYDSTHTLMTDQTGVVLPAGTPLLAGGGGPGYLNTNSASQQCITVPAPAGGKTSGVYNQYYLFYQTIKTGPLRSCIIDMTLNGGRGQVLTASANNIVSAESCEGLCSTNTQAITEEWFVYDCPVMTACDDWPNQHVRGYKIDAGGIGPAFVAVDLKMNSNFWGQNILGGEDSMARVRLKVDYQNRQIGILGMKATIGNPTGCNTPGWRTHTIGVYSLNMMNGTATGPGGAQYNWGYNGGANDGYISTLIELFSDWGLWFLDFEFSPSGENLWTILGDQDVVGNGNCGKLHRINLIDSYTNQANALNWAIYGATQLCELPGEPPFSASTPGDGTHGWDMQLAPDGKIYCVMNQGTNAQSWTLPSGNQPNNTSLLVIEDPNMTTIPGPTYAALNLSAFDLGGRHIGTGLPTYLSTACPCDIANITAPVVSNVLLSCADPDCSGPPNGAYKITECDCTGGSLYNACAVNDPISMPPAMVAYGKTWSPTCWNNIEQRWPELVAAVQALGTSGGGGIAQTLTMTYSFIQSGSIFTTIPSLAGSQFGPSVPVETLPGATGTFWDGTNCLTYNKSFVQSFAQWQTEIASMFNEIKLLFEGMFNTTCGYGADLTLNFTDLGYESGSADFNANIANPGNGTSFTDVNGITGIGDFRIGMSDFGFLDSGCTTGSASNILALCFNAPLTSAVIGTNKPTATTGTLLFDVNENWRADTMAQLIIPNSFSIKRTGIHEILHAFGFGHDFLTFGGVGPVGDCTALCECPCYQGDASCPGLNMCEDPPMSNNWVPCCPGLIYNPDALMGPFATPNAFATDFPTGLLGAEGIYDRRATCGIYGNPSLNFACEDGTCLAGCNYVTYYSNDPALAPYLNGIIIWDNGDPAGERCWEVEWVSPLPPAAIITPTIPFVSGTGNATCIDCGTGGADCYELNICPCNTGTAGAPAQIITDTDLSFHCNGQVGNGTTVEVDLWPGVCYEINCIQVPCPLTPITVIITASYPNCNDCCPNNLTCYELCPCDNVAPLCECPILAWSSTALASTFTLLQPTAFPGATFWLNESNAFAFYTTSTNGFTATTFKDTITFYGTVALNPATACPVVPGDGSQLYIYGDNLMPWAVCPSGAPNPFVGGPYVSWASVIADPYSVAAGAVITDNFNAWVLKLNVFYSCSHGCTRGINPCAGSTVVVPVTNTCAPQDDPIMGTFTGWGCEVVPDPTSRMQFISTPANGLLATTFSTMQASYIFPPLHPSAPPPPTCVDPVGGGEMSIPTHISAHMLNLGGPLVPYPGMVNTVFYTWASLLTELINATPPLATLGDTWNMMRVNANMVALQASGTVQDLTCYGTTCLCSSSTPPCTTVTNDLSGDLGNVVQLGPGPPAPLAEDTCYIVGECGPCTTDPADPCTPVGPVTLIGPFVDCDACEAGTACNCYLLRECDNLNITINNVCANVDLDNAFLNGEIVKINGGQTCYHVECCVLPDCICDPLTCIVVAVTGVYASCFMCSGSHNYECDFPGSCTCVQSAGPAFATCPLALADLDVNGSGQPCCPSIIEYECETNTCNCVPCLVPPCPAYNVGPNSAANLAACLADTTYCCSNTDPTYNCIYDASSPSYTCVDPGDGSGLFTGASAAADCALCLSANCSHCYIPSWNCDHTTGACSDPGTGLGTFNDSNGGLAACVGCVGCALDPLCIGTTVEYDCDPIDGCVQNWLQTGTYPDITSCVQFCASEEPDSGTYEGDCVNCLEELDMKALFEKVSDMCEECNVPYGLTEQETTCEDDCFSGNVYMFLDVTSMFSHAISFHARLQLIANFKTNVLVPAFNKIQINNPSYQGHLYILLGAFPYNSYGMCFDNNNTGGQAPGSGANLPESWLQWAQYPLSGNAGASGPGANPMASGTLPASQRVVLANTMVDGVGGAPWICNGGAYDPAVHKSLMEQIIILPGSYVSDGFTQLNPWQDLALTAGMSDPYHEFEGGDRDARVILFTAESAPGYYEQNGAPGALINAFTTPQGICGAPLTLGVPSTNWNGYGLSAGGLLTTEWKTDYTNFMSLHQFGWDVNGVSNALPQAITQRVLLFAGSHALVGPPPVRAVALWAFQYHLYQAIGGKAGTVSAQGHISCSQYRPIPAVYGQQAYAVTDPSIPNMYMGSAGNGDPALTTGYKGGSLSNYGIDFHIPEGTINDLTAEELYRLMTEYLTDC